jgi:hypothetical protein
MREGRLITHATVPLQRAPKPRGAVGVTWRSGAAMRRGILLALLPVLVATVGCRSRRGAAPDWVQSSPAGTVMGLSGQTGWVIRQPAFQKAIGQYPLAEQVLELFLRKARINPLDESGRITFYLLGGPAGARPDPASSFLIQLGGFKSPAALMGALTEAFPPEGSLPLGKENLPLFVVMDVNQVHVRAATDGQGRIWLGDLTALTRIRQGDPGMAKPLEACGEWINLEAPIQCYLRPEALLRGGMVQLPPNITGELPRGIEALAWSVTPGKGPEPLHRLELAMVGSPEGIQKVTPWLHRFVAMATALPGAPSQSPEILQERGRVGLRCQLTEAQLEGAMSRLNQPSLVMHEPARRP